RCVVANAAGYGPKKRSWSHELTRECTKSQAALGDDRSLPGRHPRHQLRAHYAACRRLRSIPEDEELSLAPKWVTLPRLPPVARRTGGADIRDDRFDCREATQNR